MAQWYMGMLPYAFGIGCDENVGTYFRFTLKIPNYTYDSGVITQNEWLYLPSTAFTSSTVWTGRGIAYDANMNKVDDTTEIPYVGISANQGWDWSSKTRLGANDEILNNSKAALAYKRATNKFSHIVWNELVAQVYSLRMRYYNGWDSKYASVVNTLMGAGDRTLTATRFNSLRYNVGLMSSTGITEKKSGDKVLAEYFDTIIRAFNKAA